MPDPIFTDKGTNLPVDPKGGAKLFEGQTAPPTKARPSADEFHRRAQKAKDTRMMTNFESVNTFPKSIDELKGWANSLSPHHKQQAIELDKQLQQRGKSGLLDPKLSPYEKSVVEKLFHETAPHWFNQNPSHKDDLKLDPNRSELPQVDGAVAALGGQMMQGEEEADA